MNATLNNDSWLAGAKGVAAYTQLSPRTIGRWVESGMPVRRLNTRRWVIKKTAVDAWIEELAEGGLK
jgi:excisionase family DNA binding protein